MATVIDYLMTEILAGNLGDIWFQQDGTTFHLSNQSMDLLREHFGEQIISHYAGNLSSIQALEQNITHFIHQLPVEMQEQIIETWTHWVGHLRRSCGQHLKEIIFKK